MTILTLARFLASLVSAAIVFVAGYLLWTWYQGVWFTAPDGDFVRVREEWRLWTGAGLAAWSLLGGRILPLLIAKPGAASSRRKGQGQIVPGASGSVLYVERSGSPGGPTLLFTHGWGMDSTFWTYLREKLPSNFAIVVWDLPGLGRSKAPPDGHIALSDFAADLAGLLSTIDGPVVLVGHSIGGMTIQTLARDYPQALERVSGIILLNTTYTNPLHTMVFSRLLLALQHPLIEPLLKITVWLHPLVWLSKWQSYLSGSTHAAMRLGFGKFVTRGQLQHASLLATRAAPAVEAKGDQAMLHWDATGALAAIRTPVLVVGGDIDIVTKLEASRVIASGASRAEMHTVSGVNHMGPMERADEYRDAIVGFVNSLQASAPR